MSYSRWTYSRWYTFWKITESKYVDNQMFCICSVTDFVYKKLKEDLDACIKEVAQIDPEATPEELNELKNYMKKFIKEVETKKIQENLID